MNKNETIRNFMNDLLNAANYEAKDEQKIDIACRKRVYEKRLDEMWSIYMVNPSQIVEYNKQLVVIKKCGCKVLRNNAGKHKIVVT